MNDNPYHPTVESQNYGETLPPAAARNANDLAPTGLTVISILCLVVGSLGLLGSLMAFLGPIFISVMESAFEQMAAAAETESERAAHLASLKMAKDNVFWGIVFGSINLVVAAMLVVGGIFCLSKKSPNVLRIGTLLAAIFVLGRAIVSLIFIQMPMFQNMEQLAANNPGQEIGQWIGVIIGFVMAAAMTGFYLFSHVYLKRQAVTDYFAKVQANKEAATA